MSILKSKLTKVLSHSLTLIMCCSLFPMGTLQTKAKDRDNSSETEEVTTIIDDSETGTNLNQFNFSEGWIADRASVDYNETEHWTNKNQWINEKAPSFELKFKGTKIELYGKKDNDLGIYAISIDDNEPIEIDAYNLDAQNQEKLFEASNLTNEEHVLRFQILDKRNPMANDSKPLGAQIDFAKVYSTEIVNPNKNKELRPKK